MATEVKILVQGITNADTAAESGTEHTQPTITLVRDGNVVMVVDPGILESQQVLVDALAKENLTVKDVNVVCVTHSHFDHYRNVGMFPNAKTLEYYGLWSRDTIENWSENFTPDIQVLHTPGHDYTGLTLLVKTKDGVVAICGDIFWRENYPTDPHDDVFASNPERLKESRDMVLKMSDWIIPGHGPMYKSNKGIMPKGKKRPAVGVVEKEVAKITVRCKKCGTEMKQHDKCACRPYLCFRDCECGYDCPTCGCSHKK